MTRAGFPHSDIPGSTLIGSSPRLIAASYVLHRLLAPRHPPCALCNLATSKDARARYVVLKVPGSSPATRLAGRPAGSGSGQSLVARCSRPPKETLPQSSTVCAAGTVTFLPPFPTPCGAVLGEPASSPTE